MKVLGTPAHLSLNFYTPLGMSLNFYTPPRSKRDFQYCCKVDEENIQGKRSLYFKSSASAFKACDFQRVGFPGSLAGKEFAYNAEDPCLIPGSGRFHGEGIDYPLQYSWAFLVAQTVKNLPIKQETWV